MARLKVQLTHAELEALVDLLAQWLRTLPQSSFTEKWMVYTLADLYGRLFPRLSILRKHHAVGFRATEACALASLIEHVQLSEADHFSASLLQRLFSEFDRRLQ
jgi:hypothetical protein